MANTKRKPDMPIVVKNFHLITYGNGNVYDASKWEKIKNREWRKPAGGLWASPVGCAYGWKQWCEAESYGNLETSFETDYTGNTLIIDSLSDLDNIIWQPQSKYVSSLLKYPDFEAMVSAGVDGIYLTELGEKQTRYSEPGLYGWDCECVLVMNPACIKAR